MGGTCDSRPRRRRVDSAAKEAFLAALRDGVPRDEAAAKAGFTPEAFYYARRRDGVFRFAWTWALELSAADERAAFAAARAADPDETIAPNANRRLQRRRVRRRRFDDKRKRVFLAHFAGTADAHAAAAAAAVGYSTVTQHRLNDAEFARGWDEALAVAYAALEAEALRQRLDAQRRLREGLVPAGEIAKEFDRVIRLLARYERRNGRIGPREVGPGHERRWTLIAELDRKLRALGARSGIAAEPVLLPPPADSRS
jgi:hypothetical protein